MSRFRKLLKKIMPKLSAEANKLGDTEARSRWMNLKQITMSSKSFFDLNYPDICDDRARTAQGLTKLQRNILSIICDLFFTKKYHYSYIKKIFFILWRNSLWCLYRLLDRLSCKMNFEL